MWELEKNPEWTFMQVEMAFFTEWYSEQTPEMKSKVKQFVKTG